MSSSCKVLPHWKEDLLSPHRSFAFLQTNKQAVLGENRGWKEGVSKGSNAWLIWNLKASSVVIFLGCGLLIILWLHIYRNAAARRWDSHSPAPTGNIRSGRTTDEAAWDPPSVHTHTQITPATPALSYYLLCLEMVVQPPHCPLHLLGCASKHWKLLRCDQVRPSSSGSWNQQLKKTLTRQHLKILGLPLDCK